MVQKIIFAISKERLPLHNEKKLQVQLAAIFTGQFMDFEREKDLSPFGVIDFLIDKSIGVEIKIKGTKASIYRQCKRYCLSHQVTELILVTNKSMGMPATIEGKPCHVVNIGKNWL